jgi:hypothetical protein
MSNEQTSTPPEFLAMRDEGLGLGFIYGMDFAIQGVPADLSSEAITFDRDENQYVVFYYDMGRYKQLFASESFPEAKERFLEEIARLTAPRGRGKYAGRKVPSRRAGMTPEEVFEEMRHEGRFK